MKYRTISAGADAVAFVRLCYTANRPPCFIGWHGVGKTQLMKQAADELGIEHRELDLTLRDQPDLAGLPRITNDATMFLPPTVLPRDGKGLIVLGELNRAPQHVRVLALQFLLDRVLNDYQLPAGWLPAVTMNPADGEYETDLLDPAVMSRMAPVHIVPNREEWCVWARHHGVHPDVISYVESDPTVFDHPDSNPRAWEAVSLFLVANEALQGSQHILELAIESQVARERAQAFLSFRKNPERPLSAVKILATICTANVGRWLASGRLDLVSGSVKNILIHLQSASNTHKATRGKKRQHLQAFVNALPGDLQAQVEKFFVDHGYDYRQLMEAA